MTSVSLRQLSVLPGVVRLLGDAQVKVRGVCSDSRRVEPGDLFAALPGRSVDGLQFVEQALARGARAILGERELALAVPQLVVDDARARLGVIAQQVYGDPTRELATVGVTGTNGKTTVTHLLESVLLEAGSRPALMGTVAVRGPLGEEAAELTTPEADRVAKFARRERDAGATHLVMEVSSVALAEQRLSGMHFDVAAFTNLSHDHLDYHHTLEAYGAQKARLFTEYEPGASVIMVDEPFGAALAARAAGKVVRCASRPGTVEGAAVAVRSHQFGRDGIRAELDTPAGRLALESPLFGTHNVENLALTVGIALTLGVAPEPLLRGLRTAKGAPGRMERVPDRRGVLILVDYAHTPAALERALAAVRPLTPGRLFVVFGCGGDRDRQKRAPMAEAAVRGADVAVLTADNPRHESLAQILADMEPGAAAHAPKLGGKLKQAARGYAVIQDRAEAIAAALEAARAHDTVLIAGKGHEPYQIVGNTRYGFDDRIQAARALSSLGGG